MTEADDYLLALFPVTHAPSEFRRRRLQVAAWPQESWHGRDKPAPCARAAEAGFSLRSPPALRSGSTRGFPSSGHHPDHVTRQQGPPVLAFLSRSRPRPDLTRGGTPECWLPRMFQSLACLAQVRPLPQVRRRPRGSPVPQGPRGAPPQLTGASGRHGQGTWPAQGDFLSDPLPQKRAGPPWLPGGRYQAGRPGKHTEAHPGVCRPRCARGVSLQKFMFYLIVFCPIAQRL